MEIGIAICVIAIACLFARLVQNEKIDNMSKAEQRALKAYPIKIAERDGYDENLRERKGFIKGYHQAEKDNELTWEDIVEIDKLLIDLGMMIPVKSTPDYYDEVLKRFKYFKERKEK